MLADPGRALGWTGRVLTEMGFEHAGSALRLYGSILAPTPERMVGGIAFGTFGATVGRSFGPLGGIIGGFAGGTIGGWIGGWFDSPGAGIVE